jgi:hypothetical protein
MSRLSPEQAAMLAPASSASREQENAMKKITRTMLGGLLLAGSSTAVLAAGTSWHNPDTAAPPAAQPGAAQNQNQPAPNRNQTAQSQPGQNQPTQNQPTTTKDMWSQDLAARNPSPNANPQTASTGTQPSSAQQPNGWQSSGRDAKPAHRTASVDPIGDRMTEALNLLGSDGYTSIETLTPQGQQFLATAKMNGRDVSVLVDPQTHQVTNRG